METYVYDKKVINNAIALLRSIKVEGFEQAQILAEAARLICSPYKEATEDLDEKKG